MTVARIEIPPKLIQLLKVIIAIDAHTVGEDLQRQEHLH